MKEMNLISINRKQLILEDARERMLHNYSLEKIASDHGIKVRTLNKWLMSMNEEYSELRELWVDNMLANANKEINNVKDHFILEKRKS